MEPKGMTNLPQFSQKIQARQLVRHTLGRFSLRKRNLTTQLCEYGNSRSSFVAAKTETAMSRQEADLIAVLIFTYDSTPLLIHSGGTAVRDGSLGRVPHLKLFVAKQLQIIQHFRAEGSTCTRWKRSLSEAF